MNFILRKFMEMLIVCHERKSRFFKCANKCKKPKKPKLNICGNATAENSKKSISDTAVIDDPY